MLFVLIGYALVCGLLYLVQNRLIYVGAGRAVTWDQSTDFARQQGLELWPSDPTQPGVGFVRPSFHDPAPRGTIVLCHGNGENAWMLGDMARTLGEYGFRTLLYEYPGYGGRPGPPSERTIVPDLRAAIRQLDREGKGPIYLWGISLGTGVAAAACADESLPVRGLFLVLPFDSLRNAAQAHYPIIPVHLLMTDNYDTVANLAHFAHPVCIMRADHDEVVPERLTLRLYDSLAAPKKMILFTHCGHNTWPGDTPDSWWSEALDFVAPR
jgi:alpha-beta hydrolase superfamily lysophospholipase